MVSCVQPAPPMCSISTRTLLGARGFLRNALVGRCHLGCWIFGRSSVQMSDFVEHLAMVTLDVFWIYCNATPALSRRCTNDVSSINPDPMLKDVIQYSTKKWNNTMSQGRQTVVERTSYLHCIPGGNKAWELLSVNPARIKYHQSLGVSSFSPIQQPWSLETCYSERYDCGMRRRVNTLDIVSIRL